MKTWRAKVYKRSQYDDFYESPQWRKLRRQCLTRDVYRCRRCEKRMKASLLQVHHIIPRHGGGPDILSNLITLCEPCHSYIEIKGLNSAAAIEGSYEPEKCDVDSVADEEMQEDPYNRPDWHKWVYGSGKNPRI